MALHDRRADPASTALLCIILTACGGRVSEPGTVAEGDTTPASAWQADSTRADGSESSGGASSTSGAALPGSDSINSDPAEPPPPLRTSTPTERGYTIVDDGTASDDWSCQPAECSAEERALACLQLDWPECAGTLYTLTVDGTELVNDECPYVTTLLTTCRSGISLRISSCGGDLSVPKMNCLELSYNVATLVGRGLYYDRAGAIAELYVDEANLSEPFERLAERPAPFTNLSGRLLVEAYHADGSVSDWEIQFSACTLGSEICIQ